MSPLTHRYDFTVLVDVTNGNPNGDPDAGGAPRVDPETGHGLITDVCIKRKVRNYVDLVKGADPGYAIYVQEGSILNHKHLKAYIHARPGDTLLASDKNKLSPQSDTEAAVLQDFMCGAFFDVRTFGALMSTDINCGKVTGPVQFGFGQSVEPITSLEFSITRMAATNEAEAAKKSKEGDDERKENRTMGSKHIVPYGLYRVHGFISARLAEKTGFSEDDLALLWEAIANMFEHDRSAARGEMTVRNLVVFEHSSALGNAPAHKLFDRVKVERSGGALGDPSLPPARKYSDYRVTIDRDGLPAGVTIHEVV